MHEIESWVAEKRSAYLYRVVAGRETGTARQALFAELAQEADKQAAIWERHDAAPGVRCRSVSSLTCARGSWRVSCGASACGHCAAYWRR